MQLRNKHGTPVDPVPFLLVTAIAFLVCYSYGPPYCMAFGLSLGEALAVPTLAFVGTTLVAYHRFVWTVRPDLRGEVPAGLRFKRLVYGVLVGVAGLVLLAIPLVLLR